MVQFFLIILITNIFSSLILKNLFKWNILFQCVIFLMFVYFFFTCYFNNKFFLTFNNNYNNNQLFNYLLINLFNTNWTNLYLLILLLLFYFTFTLKINSVTIYYFFIQNNLIYIISLIIYIFLKNFSEIYIYVTEKIFLFVNFIPDINTLLLNNLVLIHPIFTHFLYGYFLFYIFYYIFVKWVTLQKYNRWVKFNKINNFIKFFFFSWYINIVKQNLFFSIISFLAILLGSIWAAQELVWNSWWNWDIIEIIAFGFFILLIFYIHVFKKKNIFIKIYNYMLDMMIIFLLFYFFIRLDISASLHSFNLFDAIEIYLYLFYLFFITVIYFIFLKKKFLKQSIKKNYLHLKFKKYDYLIVFFKFFLLSLYFYCFIIWFNDSENYIIKNEVIWIYSILYKYIFILLYLNYYLFIFKLNWFFFVIVCTNFMIYIIIYKFLKNVYTFFRNLYIIMHISILLYVCYTLIDDVIQLISQGLLITQQFEYALLYFNKKLFLYFWNINNSVVNTDIFFSNYVFLKQNFNSFLLIKEHYLNSTHFNLNFWQEQSYNYYTNINFLEVLLKNLYYKEQKNFININKTTHYSILSLFFIIVFSKIFKKNKILIFF